MTSADSPLSRPPVSGWLQAGFHRFLTPYLRRHFHAIAITRAAFDVTSIAAPEPLIMIANHPSWWDPLMAHFVNRRLFPDRQFFAPIDAAALQQYRVFAKLGFYGVPMDSREGAAAFLQPSRAILMSEGASLWLTPEGRFTDVRDHSATLMPGAAHLCSHLSQGWVLPFALEYVFWEERLPVCLCHIGTPLSIASQREASKSDWQRLLTTRLRQTQTELSAAVIARDADAFENLLTGIQGAGFLYDSMRRLKSLLSGSRFKAAHGDKLQ
ncbi:MAG: lysophospholipid acyltransferase family protein [Novipirellula sp. JB048]